VGEHEAPYAVAACLLRGVESGGVWFAVDPAGWRSFEDRHGPVRAIATFVLAAAVAVLGLRRTAAAGWMLLVLGVVPVAVSSLGHHGQVSLAVMSAPVLTGALYLWSAAITGRAAPVTHPAGPPARPRAA
jgi:hypothetical protein